MLLSGEELETMNKKTREAVKSEMDGATQLTEYEANKMYPQTQEEVELEAKGYEEWLKTQPPRVKREQAKKLQKALDSQAKLVNFRLMPQEYEGLRILAELTGMTQADIVRDLIRAEIRKQEEAIEAYKKSIEEVKGKIKK